MANSGYVDVAVTSHNTLRLSWWQESQSITNNTTTLTWAMYLIADSSGRISTSSARAWGVTFNGNAHSGSTNCSVANGGTTLLGTTGEVITHNTNGTKTCDFSFWYNFTGITFAGTALGTVSGSGTATLNTIPRASSITVPTFTMGTAGAITITRASSSFTHTLKWKFGSASGTITTKTTATSVSWTPDTPTLAAQVPTAMSGTGTITCETYSGQTLIGSSSKTFTAKVPSTVVPVISAVADVETVSGLASKFGCYVQNKSKPKLTTTAAGVYGSTIKSYETVWQNETTTGNPVTVSPPTRAGTVSGMVTVTDSRGQSVRYKKSIEVVAYAAPVISQLTVSRVNADHVADTEGNYVAVKFKYACSPVNNRNTCTAKIEYKLRSASTWSTLATYTDLSKDNTVYPTAVLSSDQSFDVRLTVTDYFSTVETKKVLMSSLMALDVMTNSAGTQVGVAVGKVAEAYDFEVGLPAVFSGSITAGGHSSPIGSAVNLASPAAKSVASGTWAEVGHIDLPPGTWIICGTASFAGTGNYSMGVSVSVDPANFEAASVSYGRYIVWGNTIRLVTFSEPTSFYLTVYQASGAAMTITPRMLRAVRLV